MPTKVKTSGVDNTPVLSEQSWQQQLSASISSIAALCAYLEVALEELPASVAALHDFPLRVPLSFAKQIEKGNPNDPLLRQILPVSEELLNVAEYTDDPVGDLSAAKVTGVIHKYHGRVLLINTGTCAIHCRYCFRRHFPYSDLQLSKQQEAAALMYIAEDSSINEVILSGGDPLLLSDARLAKLLTALASIPHIKRIRIHTRLPIVLPARITAELLAILQACSAIVCVVTHCNHANELSAEVVTACRQLQQHGLIVFNQAVLLKGINDDVAVLSTLSEQLFAAGIIPYYLHLLDKTRGTAHFNVDESRAVQLFTALQNSLPGYLVPRLVKEIAGAGAKQSIV
jgi:EF-P beta-lysylation protein EpmB